MNSGDDETFFADESAQMGHIGGTYNIHDTSSDDNYSNNQYPHSRRRPSTFDDDSKPNTIRIPLLQTSNDSMIANHIP